MSSPIGFLPPSSIKRRNAVCCDTPRPQEEGPSDLEKRLESALSSASVADLSDLWGKLKQGESEVQGISPERVTDMPPPVLQEDLFAFAFPEDKQEKKWLSKLSRHASSFSLSEDNDWEKAQVVADLQGCLNRLAEWVDSLETTWRREFLVPPPDKPEKNPFFDLKNIENRWLGTDEIIDAYINTILKKFSLDMMPVYQNNLKFPANLCEKLPRFLSKTIHIDFAGRFSGSITERVIAERISQKLAIKLS